MQTEPGVLLAAIIVIVIALFFLLREVSLWYWKIGEHIELQKEIRDILKQISQQQNSRWLCRKCGEINRPGKFCTRCGLERLN